MIFGKSARTIQWGKNSLFNKRYWDNWIFTLQKIYVGSQPHTIEEKNPEWVKCLNVKAKFIKLLEENIGMYLHHLRFAKGFLDKTLKA